MLHPAASSFGILKRLAEKGAGMANDNFGQSVWSDPGIHSAGNGYLNPNFTLDQGTHVGREILSEASQPLNIDHVEAGNNKNTKAVFFLIAILMVLIFFIVPGRS